MTVELRAPTLDDLEQLTDLINRDGQELHGMEEESLESMQLWLTGPALDPETDIRVAVVNGTFRGYVDVDADPEPTYWADLRVPLSEGNEVRASLMAWAEHRAEERAKGRTGARLRFFAASIDEPMKTLLSARGYRQIRHFYRMRIEFTEDVPAPEWPAGAAVRAATQADGETVYEAHQESFEDSWEHNRMPFDEWQHWFMSEGFDPTLWFIAEDGADVAAVAICREHEAESGLGWVRVLGVRRPWRRRGLGRALLLHAFREFRQRGFHAAALGVDAASLTGANRLYESVGMRVVRQSHTYERELAAGSV
jgi:mycothiol synthase